MVQVTATVETVGPRAAQLYVIVPRWLTVKLEELPLGVQAGDQIELVLQRVDSGQQELEEAA